MEASKDYKAVAQRGGNNGPMAHAGVSVRHQEGLALLPNHVCKPLELECVHHVRWHVYVTKERRIHLSYQPLGFRVWV